ncbi:hypothetical protein [Cellulomonas phragmiteti]|uniref:Uncharacterized protein n=1 Tax=Cellulomonas phragmiteti TaxID=478780 RepID=A0ABQ4DMH1_9CELL|nr:hypothetical protein [Cellulomonas phragmiteti]GIG40549.1 hypothetical protein Cph01nite_23110 [Cellulomonas phragmiteti]
METHSAAPDPQRAGELLADLAGDRSTLARHATTPSWYVPTVAALTAAYVAVPLLGEDRTPTVSMIGGALLVLAVLVQQRRRVRLPGAGVAGAGLVVTLLAVVLLLLSVSFGLVAGGLHVWVALPVLAAGAVAYALLRRLDAAGRRAVDRVR